MYKGNRFVWRANLKPTEKLVLLFLCETADYYGRANFSLKLLSSVCGISELEACIILSALEDAGMLYLFSPGKKDCIEKWLSVTISGDE